MSAEINQGNDEWWGFSSKYGWVVLDRNIDANRPGKSVRLLFLRCDGWIRYEEDRDRWVPPHYYFSERYIEKLSEKEVLVARAHLRNLKQEYKVRKEDNYLSVVQERHRQFMSKAGRIAPESKRASKKNRVSHCWSCKQPVDNTIDLECSACNWIICGSCGACGCTYGDRLCDDNQYIHHIPEDYSQRVEQPAGQLDECTILILAKSYKQGGYCIAGREFILNADGKYSLGPWIRPVSNLIDNKNPISAEMCLMSNGHNVGVFDVVRIFLSREAPEAGQPENIIIDEAKSWQWLYKLNYSDITTHIETPNSLWLEQQSSPERVSSSVEFESSISQSLYLIQPKNLVITLSNGYNDYQQGFHKEIHASFDYNGNKYVNLSVTDPKVRRMLNNQYPSEGQPDVSMNLKKGDDYILCVSLGPRFGGAQAHWKFVATIYDFDGYIQRTY